MDPKEIERVRQIEEMNIKTREANVTDFQQMLDLYKELDDLHLFEHPELFVEPEGDIRPLEYIQDLIEDENKYLVVAEEGHRLIGFAECVVMEASAFPVIRKRKWVELNSLVVLKEFQNKGVGKILLQCVTDWSREKGINRIELKVYTFNTSASEFYSKVGFKPLNTKMYLDQK